jgi:hypothetical protein
VTTTSTILIKPLRSDQKRLVDLIAEAFVQEDYHWPIYHYLDWILEEEGIDAWETLSSLPQVGRWGYGPIAWVRQGPAIAPRPDAEIRLTVVGFHHSSSLGHHMETLFQILDYMAEERRALKPSPRSYFEAEASSKGFAEHCRARGLEEIPHPRLSWHLLEQEPPVSFGSRSFDTESGEWTRTVSRGIRDFRDLGSLPDYLDRLEASLGEEDDLPASYSGPAIPLTTAIDHLDDVWRLVFKTKLFELRGAERIASLESGASSREEFEARLSAVGDLLRGTNTAVSKQPGRRTRGQRLPAIRSALAAKLDSDEYERAVELLEAVLALRDSRQHGAAAHGSVEAARRLGLIYPVPDGQVAWTTTSAQLVAAFSEIAAALRSTLD